MHGLYMGVVKWFNETKGWGFITVEDEKTFDIFVHFKEIARDGQPRRALLPGQRVEFGIKKTERGPAATNVRVLDKNL